MAAGVWAYGLWSFCERFPALSASKELKRSCRGKLQPCPGRLFATAASYDERCNVVVSCHGSGCSSSRSGIWTSSGPGIPGTKAALVRLSETL
eukprot:scaffold74666_cov42-Prasinocladus_malaysianus.AAC.2